MAGTQELLNFIAENRIYIIMAVIAIWIVWFLHHIGAFQKAKMKITAKAPTPTVPPEQRLAITETELKRLKKETERLTLTLAQIEKKQMEADIEKMAEQKIKTLLPEKLWIFDPKNNLTGRPIYFIGGIPVINKDEEIKRLIEENSTLKFLSKLSPALAQSLANHIYFGQSDTLYFYSAQLLPNGRWAITATSKPPKKTTRYIKLKMGTKPYVLLTGQHSQIDNLILNKWEATHAQAAIHLAATILGPIPLEEYAKHYQGVGWEEHGKET